jgi:hypothetical protein
VTFLRSIRRARHASYRAGSVLGDVSAVGRAWETRSATPIVHRAIRKTAWRRAAGALWNALRTILR